VVYRKTVLGPFVEIVSTPLCGASGDKISPVFSGRSSRGRGNYVHAVVFKEQRAKPGSSKFQARSVAPLQRAKAVVPPSLNCVRQRNMRCYITGPGRRRDLNDGKCSDRPRFPTGAR
jgi:hypothetical protein